MARDIYYQDVGNPLQLERLPKRRPDVQLSFHPDTPGHDARYAVKLLFLFGLLSLAAMFAQLMHVHARLGSEPPSIIWTNFFLIAFVPLLIVKAVKLRNARWLGPPLGCLVAAILSLNLPTPFIFQLLVASATLGLFTWLLVSHWTMLCTASPLDRSTAARLHSGWSGYLTLAVIAPAVFSFIAVVAPGAFALTLLVIFLLFQVVASVFATSRRGRFSTPWQALVSWLTYNRRDAKPPGIFRSPAGDWLQRMAVTGLCVFVLSTTYARCPSEVLDCALHSDGPNPAAAFMLTFYPWPTLMTDTPSLDGAVGNLTVMLLTFFVPVTITFLAPLVLSLPVLVQAETYRNSNVTAGNWRSLVGELRSSVDPIERDSLYMGRNAHDGSPLIVPRSVFHEHAHFLGDSGSGKTAQGLAPTVEQAGSRGDCSIIALDLKADSMELLGTLKATAEEGRRRTGRKIPLKHFSNQVGRSTFAFNPLLQPYWRDLDLYMRTDILCGALGLTYGADYGEGYYSSANSAVLYHTMKTFPDVVTFRELADRVGYVVANAKRTELHPEIRKAGVHVQTILDRLGSFEALNVTPDGGYSPEVASEAIDFTKVFTQPEVHYYHLSSTLAPGSSPEMARLVTYSLLAAATQTERRCQVFLVIDEFQRMVARNIEYMLQLARSMGVGVILANQTMEDLRTSTANLIPPIEANCRYRQWFAVSSDDDRRRLVESSGQTVDLQVARSYSSGPNGNSKTVSYQEQIMPRLSTNDILLASDHPRQSIVRLSRGAGYAQYGGLPFVLESNYHISRNEYEERKATPWPEGATGSFVPGTATAPQAKQSTVGPVVTTQVIGSASSVADSAADLFGSFLESGGPNPAQQRKPKGKTK